MGDIESVSVSSTTSSKTKSSENLNRATHRTRSSNDLQTGQSHSHMALGGAHAPSHDAHTDISNIQSTLSHGDSGSQLIHPDFNNETPATDMLTPEQIDAILMRHDQVYDSFENISNQLIPYLSSMIQYVF